MTVYIKPSVAHGEITAPPSKSVLHRAIICAALSGCSEVDNVIFNDDIKATIAGLSLLGADIKLGTNKVTAGGFMPEKCVNKEIDCNESGSTLRFLIPLAMYSGSKIVFSGSERLFSRDLSVYREIAKEQGIEFTERKNSVTVCGKIKSGIFKVRGDISSQFVSGLMFVLPLLDGDSKIEFTTKIESQPYIDLTIKVLSEFGIVIKSQKNGYYVSGNQIYKNKKITAEGDYSNAAFLDAFNLLGGKVKVKGLKDDTVQGDRIYKDYFKNIKSGGTFSLNDCPDLAPILFALAAEFSGAHFTGTARLNIKESDRANAMKEELSKLGAEILVYDDDVIIKGTKLHAPELPICSHNDHRIVMALSVLLSKYGGIIEGAEAVNKSYPQFFTDIKGLGIEVKTDDN